MAGRSKQEEALARLRAYLEKAVSSELPLTDTVLIEDVAKVGRATFYDYLKKVPGLEQEIQNARREQAKFLGDTPAGRNRRKVRERIEKLEARVAALEEANLALLAEKAAFVDALRGPACRVPADKIQRALGMALSEADRSLSGAGRRTSPGARFRASQG